MLGAGHCDPGPAEAVRDFLAGRDTATGAVLGLTRRDWRRDTPQDRGTVRDFPRPPGS